MFAQSAFAFAVLKYIGGAYLLYLGARAIHGAMSHRRGPEGRSDRGPEGSAPLIGRSALQIRSSVCFAQGLLTNLLNPKVAVFYVTFLPQFVAPDRPVLSQSMFLAATHVVMGLIWLPLYARFIDRMAAVLLTDRVKRRIEAATGAVLMALGIRLALARR